MMIINMLARYLTGQLTGFPVLCFDGGTEGASASSRLPRVCYIVRPPIKQTLVNPASYRGY